MLNTGNRWTGQRWTRDDAVVLAETEKQHLFALLPQSHMYLVKISSMHVVLIKVSLVRTLTHKKTYSSIKSRIAFLCAVSERKLIP